MDLHTKPKNQYEIEELRKVILLQLRQAMTDVTWVTCATCGLKAPLWKLYRCYYCGIWICEKCCEKHFGKKREILSSILER